MIWLIKSPLRVPIYHGIRGCCKCHGCPCLNPLWVLWCRFIWSVVNGYVGSFGDCSTHPAVNDYPGFGVQVSNSQGSCSNTPSLIQNTDQKGILTGQGINVQNSTANFTVLAVRSHPQDCLLVPSWVSSFSASLCG